MAGRYSPEWLNTNDLKGIRFVCGYCGTDTSPARGWHSNMPKHARGYVGICTYCNQPSFIETVSERIIKTTPAPKMGDEISGLPDDVDSLYSEARDATGAGAHTSAVLTCRKILMHVAVEKGAEINLTFLGYVQYLSDNHYIPAEGKGWVDYIRAKSNDANHQILIVEKDDAERLISFTELLLRVVYETKHKLPDEYLPQDKKGEVGDEAGQDEADAPAE